MHTIHLSQDQRPTHLGVHANKQNFEVAKQENSVIFLEDNYQEKYGGFNPNSPESVIGITLLQEEFLDQSLGLASIVESKFADELKVPSRGVKQAGFVVLHQTNMPAILIETGFITNPKEGAFLHSKSGQEKVAKIIAEAVLTYKKNLEQNTVVEAAKPKNTLDTTASGKNLEGVLFKVQIAAGANKLALKPYNFKGLKNVEMEKVGNIYKYYYGSTTDYNSATKKLAEAKKNGYPSAFIIGIKEGKVVPVN
ncbi:MAG: N-acetylmuramoyl-L-alanine amidase [Flavobacteriaceae bacterium]|nr:N-acetylmuramoyl-L-alanine amidase [Flavobacteriaceae bacterium]